MSSGNEANEVDRGGDVIHGAGCGSCCFIIYIVLIILQYVFCILIVFVFGSRKPALACTTEVIQTAMRCDAFVHE